VGYETRSDADLLAAAGAGDSRAFGELWDRHRDRVFGHALRLTAVRADAEDAAAITFLEAWRNRTRVRAVDGSILPWLLVTTTNVCRNLSRAGRRYRSALQHLPVDVDPGEPTEADLDLRAALQELSPIDQQLFSLTLEGFTTDEAAEAVGLSPGAARTRMSRARQRLRRFLSSVSTPSIDLSFSKGPR
jgi:RNA polymerase sigma-70 factor (ECF subfamily)